MVDKVGDKLTATDIPKVRNLLRKLAQTIETGRGSKQVSDWEHSTPYTAKKARRLSYTPTDADLDSPVLAD